MNSTCVYLIPCSNLCFKKNPSSPGLEPASLTHCPAVGRVPEARVAVGGLAAPAGSDAAGGAQAPDRRLGAAHAPVADRGDRPARRVEELLSGEGNGWRAGAASEHAEAVKLQTVAAAGSVGFLIFGS